MNTYVEALCYLSISIPQYNVLGRLSEHLDLLILKVLCLSGSEVFGIEFTYFRFSSLVYCLCYKRSSESI